ncbi:hypothetical protein C8Q76DRAFT_789679 [Earliella scabrosa]|nr:hypothetical protein C8Q76DRAFT_789679 [Earliella scabrosa]
MPPPKRASCQVCVSTESKYTCAKCSILYCSVACYKKHKESCGGPRTTSSTPKTSVLEPGVTDDSSSEVLAGPSSTSPEKREKPLSEEQEPPLRPLASLRWPYVPEESAYPDPLKRDDPKPLQISQYEAIATSPTIRRVLASNPRLREIVRSIDTLRGEDRELALQEVLGVGGSRTQALASLGHASPEDRDALRQLAEAVEAAVRGGKQDTLGLDWGD